MNYRYLNQDHKRLVYKYAYSGRLSFWQRLRYRAYMWIRPFTHML